MNRRKIMGMLAGLALLPGCGGRERVAASEPPPAPLAWRSVATEADRGRIRTWRDAWTKALAEARGSGNAAQVAAEGALLQPDVALTSPAPPPGDYRCRVTKLGTQGSGSLTYVAYPPFRCRIALEKDVLSFTKLDGSQRPVGLLFPDDPSRLIFLGTMMLGDERMALDYGRDPERDMAGLVERIGPARWRLVLPSPRWESRLDVMELVPG